MPSLPFIPDTITVHLGAPNDASAPNVTIPFVDYIQNVASSEIYPTWPDNALRANIYAQISFALNRIYTEYYRSRGYPFDITSSTAYDQSFVYGRDIFDNIANIVNDIFNSYIRREGNVEPLYAQFCDGIRVSCPGGLSQWGSVELAQQQLTPFEILQRYYGNDIELVQNVPVGSIEASVPSFPLRIGSTGDEVRTVQIRLNRISDNFPSIPKIVATDGIFTTDTEAAVLRFQEIFNLTPDGIVGQATWYAIERLYASVKRLNELDSEGISLGEVTLQYPSVLQEGSVGLGVRNLQFFLRYLSDFYPSIPSVGIDGVFGQETLQAVRDFQLTFGLPVDGIVGEQTWYALYNAYRGIVNTIPLQYIEGNVLPFPGQLLRLGSESESVRILQQYLNVIASVYSEIPTMEATGYFGEITRSAVQAVQNLVGLEPNGIVGVITWNAITDLYSDIYNGSRLNDGQYPGYEIGGSDIE
ncbi:MAG: peptidoglycan-binding protein [Clostridia bacterium]|nr:peptidoglycan-binding protein [Clostridia bacterium]